MNAIAAFFVFQQVNQQQTEVAKLRTQLEELDQFPYPIVSSAISRIGYDVRQKDLRVKWTSGKKYVYRGVPEEKVKDLVHGDSPGKYFNEHIRDVFPFEQIA